MDGYRTPPHATLATPSPTTPRSATPDVQLATPVSLNWESPKSTTPIRNGHVPAVLTQTEVDSNPTVKRLQQDLLILTGFNDNSTLHWRPAWFTQGSFGKKMWTLHNPPGVVTERLPNDCKGVQLFTRRMRRTNDPPPQYIRNWDHWKRYCELYGIPYDFLCEEQVQLLRMGLSRSADGSLCTPPQCPLYPEPSSQGHYVLTPTTYSTHLPRKFQNVVSTSWHIGPDHAESIVVNPTGAITVELQEKCASFHVPPKGYRWSYIPWTTEMEESCRPLTVRLRLWNQTEERQRTRSNM